MDLSIIIPVYNSQKFLLMCAESILKCEEIEIQCILIEDGSVDCSKKICEDIVKKDDRFLLISKENGGASSARNLGLKYATGTYVMFLDADDMLTEEAINLILKHIEEENCADFIAFNYITLYANGKEKTESFQMVQKESYDFSLAKTLMYASSQLNTCWGKLFKKEILDRYCVKFPEELSVGEDFVFVAEYFKHCRSFCVCQEPILYYRQHKDSAMHNHSFKERLEYTQTLYRYNKEQVLDLKDGMLLQKMYNYYIRVLTNLFLEFSKSEHIVKLSKEYKKAFRFSCVAECVEKADMSQMRLYKKIEFFMLKKRMYFLLALYFKCKSCLAGER